MESVESAATMTTLVTMTADTRNGDVPHCTGGQLTSMVNGHKLHCRYWKPQTQPRAVVFIAHGYAEHSAYYEELAEELFKESFYVFAHDHLGHGRSDGIRGQIDSVDEYVNDIIEHFKKIEEDESLPVLPYFLVGHSMGGTIAIKLAMKRPDMFKGIVLISPAVITNPDLAYPLLFFFARFLGRFLPRFPIAPIDHSNATRNVEQVEKLKKDELCLQGRVKARWAAAMLEALQEIHNNLTNMEWPFLLLHGTSDIICDISGSKLLMESSASKDKTFKIYEDAYHSLLKEYDEIKDSCLREIVEWISKRVCNEGDFTNCITEIIKPVHTGAADANASPERVDSDLAERLEILKISEEAVVEVKPFKEQTVSEDELTVHDKKLSVVQELPEEQVNAADATESTEIPPVQC